MKLEKTGKNEDLSKQCTIGYYCQFDHYTLLLSAMHVGWMLVAVGSRGHDGTISLWRLFTLNSWTLTPEWASSHHPSFLQMNQSTIVFMALCLVAGINAGLFNHRIQSHHNNVHKVIIPSTQQAAMSQYFHWLYSRGPAMNCGEASDLTATSTTLWRRATTCWTRQTCKRCLMLLYITWKLYRCKISYHPSPDQFLPIS